MIIVQYLTIIPRARMGYWFRGYEGERDNCFSEIQLVGQKISRPNTFRKLKLDNNPFLALQIWMTSGL